MARSEETDVTQLLDRWAAGERAALDDLMPLVYGELRKIADAYLRRERSDHTLQPTALVHEAWLGWPGRIGRTSSIAATSSASRHR